MSNIERRITEREFVRDGCVQIVVCVFAFPIAPVEAVAVFHRPVRALLRTEEMDFVHQHQVFGGAIVFKQVGKRPPQ